MMNELKLICGLLIVGISIYFIYAISSSIKKYGVRKRHKEKIKERSEFYDQFCRELHLDRNEIEAFSIQTKNAEQYNYFILGYPYWRYSNKDGTRDKRHKERNDAIYPLSELHVMDYIVRIDDPLMMISLVKKIRDNNPQLIIQRSREEQNKYNWLKERSKQCRENNSALSVYRRYATDPYAFESFIADLYRKMGYAANTTSKTNDGGYDVYFYNDAITGIIECKCYKPDEIISRSLLQKLAGANAVIKADLMVFITTCRFSKEAENYANRTGIKIIDGVELIRLIRQYEGDGNHREGEIPRRDWELNESDVLSHYPKDMI